MIKRPCPVWHVVMVLAVPLMIAGICDAGSLWSEESTSLFVDRRTYEPGDLLTLIIVQEAEATQKASTTSSKEASIGIGPGAGVLGGVIPQIKASGGDELTGGGTTTRGGSVRAKMTVKVMEVLPRGNLVVEGRQQIEVNSELQEIVVRGLVRPADINLDNTVYSTDLAEASISYKGTGILGAKQKPGILTRILNWLF